MALMGCMLGFAIPVSAQVVVAPPVVVAPAVATPNAGVPEIDAGMLGSGLTILAGGLMILRSRFRTRVLTDK